jgi:hypothetical protein
MLKIMQKNIMTGMPYATKTDDGYSDLPSRLKKQRNHLFSMLRVPKMNDAIPANVLTSLGCEMYSS